MPSITQGKQMNSRKLLGILLVFTIFPSLSIAFAFAPYSHQIRSSGSITYEPNPPYIRGWGSSRIHESNLYKTEWTNQLRTKPPSEVFIGEVASDLEMTVRLLLSRGYNGIRINLGFDPTWSQSPAEPKYWGWDETLFIRTLNICKHYDIWMIACYGGGDCDAYQHTDEWIAFWQDKVRKYGPLYDKIVWEPCNEPLPYYSDGSHELTGQAAVDLIGQLYQRWIDMCRNLGDRHWLVVSIVCYFNSLPEEDWWSNVTDPLNRTFLNRHHYFFYSEESTWTIAAAQARADHAFQVDKKALTKYNKPFICTEFGASTGVNIAPDQVYVNGYTGHSNTSLAFVQRLMENYESENMSYVLFPCSDVYPPDLYGDMNVWGQLLTHVTPQEREIFNNGFESGDFSAWTGTTGNPTLQSAIVYDGNYALKCDTVTAERVQKRFVRQPLIYTRMYIYFSSLPTNDNRLTFLEHYEHTSGINDIIVGVRNLQGVNKWYVTFPPWGGGPPVLAPSGPVVGRWYCIELKTSLSGNITSWEFWVDGNSVLVGSYTGSPNQYDSVIVGGWDKSEDLTNYVDCVVIDDAYVNP